MKLKEKLAQESYTNAPELDDPTDNALFDQGFQLGWDAALSWAANNATLDLQVDDDETVFESTYHVNDGFIDRDVSVSKESILQGKDIEA